MTAPVSSSTSTPFNINLYLNYGQSNTPSSVQNPNPSTTDPFDISDTLPDYSELFQQPGTQTPSSSSSFMNTLMEIMNTFFKGLAQSLSDMGINLPGLTSNDGPSTDDGPSTTTPTTATGGVEPENIDGGSTGAFTSDELISHLQNKYGLSRDQAAGFIGNFVQESGLHPNINQGGKLGAPDPSAPGYGLVQWSGSRRTEFENFCRQNNMNPQSKEANLAFLDKELSGDYKYVVDKVKGAGSVEEATRIVFDDYEGPGDSSLGARINNARAVL